jgi:hypothetical protein
MYVQFFAYKMTVASKTPMLKHRNVDLYTVSLKASDCTRTVYTNIVNLILREKKKKAMLSKWNLDSMIMFSKSPILFNIN